MEGLHRELRRRRLDARHRRLIPLPRPLAPEREIGRDRLSARGREFGEHRGVRDGLHDVDEQEGHALDAGAPELGLPRLEQRRDERRRLLLDAPEVLEAPDPWHLFDEHLVKPRVDLVRREHRLDDGAYRDGHGRGRHLRELGRARAHLDAITRGWQMGKAARSLFGVRWNELWARPIGDVRAALGVDPVIDAARPELAAAA